MFNDLFSKQSPRGIGQRIALRLPGASLLAACALGVFPGCGLPADASKSSSTATRQPRVSDFSYTDTSRQREIPVRLYLPPDGPGPFPLILFSPGIGNTRDHYTSLGHFWAEAGFAALFVTHPDADASQVYYTNNVADIIRAVLDAAAPVHVRYDHPRDMSFVLDQLAQDPALQGQLDLAHVAIGGHSYGGHTALALIGMVVDGAPNVADARFTAALAFSPPGVGVLGLGPNAGAGIHAPAMIMVGGLDFDPLTLSTQARQALFDQSNGPDQYLLTLLNGTHGLYDSQDPWVPDRITRPHYEATVETASTLFLSAYLRQDGAAQARLVASDLPAERGWGITLEYKNIHPRSITSDPFRKRQRAGRVARRRLGASWLAHTRCPPSRRPDRDDPGSNTRPWRTARPGRAGCRRTESANRMRC